MKPPARINQASEQLDRERSELVTEIEQSSAEIDEWVSLLENKGSDITSNHIDKIDSLETIKASLCRVKEELVENDSSIKFLRSEAEDLIEEFNNETAEMTFQQSLNID